MKVENVLTSLAKHVYVVHLSHVLLCVFKYSKCIIYKCISVYRVRFIICFYTIILCCCTLLLTSILLTTIQVMLFIVTEVVTLTLRTNTAATERVTYVYTVHEKMRTCYCLFDFKYCFV